jgi:amylosucrase
MASIFGNDPQIILSYLLPTLEQALGADQHKTVFLARLRAYFPAIYALLNVLYGDRDDFIPQLQAILNTLVQVHLERSAELRALDTAREHDPNWFQSHRMMGAVCYVDLFADNLAGLRAKIPYFKEIGLTYLHLMPLYKAPEDNSDGGYAVSDFRSVNPALGTMEELADFMTELRANGISPVLDFVFNHTSDEHEWAKRALAGDPMYQNYYFMFPDRTLPDQYERTLREIFPEAAPGSFTFRQDVGKWVWTTFNHFQWDLNYRNPAVFNAMMGEFLFLANQGAEILRLDAVAFIWKQMGTACENLPQAHMIIRAFNALTRVVAPSLLFKSEAIVHPAMVASYIDRQECPISYNPTMMALTWEALATRDVRLLRHSMSRRFDIPEDCAWVNYVRVHDDIGWTFADEDAAELNINGYNHRQFLNQFYIGKFEGSFAAGVPFSYNPITQDMRISGTCASLAGLEQAEQVNSPELRELALCRILMIYSVALSAGGIPLLYLGDEIAMLNDYSYEDDPHKAADSRWVHRPHMDWERAKTRGDEGTDAGRVFTGLQRLIAIRQRTPVFGGHEMLFFDTGSKHVLGFIRSKQVAVLANFSEQTVKINPAVLAAYGVRGAQIDLVTDSGVDVAGGVTLEPYRFVWLKAE